MKKFEMRMPAGRIKKETMAYQLSYSNMAAMNCQVDSTVSADSFRVQNEKSTFDKQRLNSKSRFSFPCKRVNVENIRSV